jgi:hypothetical protein
VNMAAIQVEPHGCVWVDLTIITLGAVVKDIAVYLAVVKGPTREARRDS